MRIIGISHLEVHDGMIQREQMVWDEFALLKQIHWQTHSQDKPEPVLVRHED